MAKIMMSITSGNTFLKGSSISQFYYPSISIKSDDGAEILRLSFTFDQLAKMLCSQTDVDCTLIRYFNEGSVKHEEVTPPETIREKNSKVFGEVFTSLEDRIKSLQDQIFELTNNGKAGKKDLASLLHEIKVIKEHYSSNYSYVLSKTEQELEKMKDSAITQIQHATGVDARILISSNEQNVPAALEPIGTITAPSSFVKKEKDINDYTCMELAIDINKILNNIKNMVVEENRQSLYNPSATFNSTTVFIKYISYHSEWKLTRYEAIKYLNFLKGITKIEDFKYHHQLGLV